MHPKDILNQSDAAGTGSTLEELPLEPVKQRHLIKLCNFFLQGDKFELRGALKICLHQDNW